MQQSVSVKQKYGRKSRQNNIEAQIGIKAVNIKCCLILYEIVCTQLYPSQFRFLQLLFLFQKGWQFQFSSQLIPLAYSKTIIIQLMKENDQRDLYFTEKIRNVAYNTRYNFLRFFQEYSKNAFAVPGDSIFILGQKFLVDSTNLESIQECVYDIFQSTPWLTYRSGFPELQNQIVGNYVTDTGWGCMIRVGQMLFAQVIKHHKQIRDKRDILNVMSLFSDFEKTQPFSIHKIARLARIQYGLKPGEWYNPSQISFILSQLHRQYLSAELKLKFCVFHSGNLFFDSVIQTMIEGKPKCKCEKKRSEFICTNCNKNKNSVGLIVLSRIGLSNPQQKYLKILQKLMQFPTCQGVIGGKPRKALYFIGKQNGHFIYLDPHYVHNANKNVNVNQQTYFCESFRKCKSTAIDSSIGICFYLRDLGELNSFYKQIHELKSENIDDFFIFVSDETPKYVKESQLKSLELNLQDDNFEMI